MIPLEIINKEKQDSTNINRNRLKEQTNGSQASDQVSPGDLIPESKDGGNKPVEENVEFESRSYKYLPVSLIQRIKEISDFESTGCGNRPRVLKTGEEYFEIDNYGLVEKAIQEGISEIYCEVVESQINNDFHRHILKVASRIRTPDGKASYPEQVRAVRQLYNLIQNKNSDCIQYEHGGIREKEVSQKKNQKDKDIRSILSESLNLNRNTISKMLNHSENLTDNTLHEFIVMGVTKKEFEKIQNKKKDKTLEMDSNGYNQDEIEEAISKFVRENIRDSKKECVATEENEATKQDGTINTCENQSPEKTEDKPNKEGGDTPKQEDQEVKHAEYSKQPETNHCKKELFQQTDEEKEIARSTQICHIQEELRRLASELHELANKSFEDQELFLEQLNKSMEKIGSIVQIVKEING